MSFDKIILEKKDNYAIITLNNGKVNAINTPLLKDLNAAFEQLNVDNNIHGVILSGRPHVFSAGMDLKSLAMLDKDGLIEMWKEYFHLLRRMVSFPKPLICAITGYAPAGATILTLCADYRIMAKGAKHVMGMHEFKMNFPIPEILSDLYIYYLGENRAWKFVQQAKQFDSEEALTLGMVDESVEVDQVLERSEDYLKKMMNVYLPVYSETKLLMRKQLADLVINRDFDNLAIEATKFSEDTNLKAKVLEYMMKLRSKKA